jgi:hypothetical protein
MTDVRLDRFHPYFTTRRYVNRPREPFYARLDRLSYAGRLEALRTAQQPGIPPSQQASFPDTIEARRELERWREGLVAPDFADELEEIREFRERFETNQRDPVESAPKRNRYLADIILAAQRREARFAPRGGSQEALAELVDSILPDPDVIFVEPTEDAEKAQRIREDKEAEFAGPARRNLFPLPNPTIANSGIQQFTGAQLDVLI